MDKKIKNKILKKLKDACEKVSFFEITQLFDQREETKVLHIIDVLEGDGLIKKTESSALLLEGEGLWFYVELTAKGYGKFIPWYKKFWVFLNDDLTKLLSLVALILSIIATYISLSK